ncbi:hypothetical protein JXB37_07920, partial [candidate division WOR-3 bacterium]|nr:hypothetical protein [candidate division WOR-3 bacterium]
MRRLLPVLFALCAITVAAGEWADAMPADALVPGAPAQIAPGETQAVELKEPETGPALDGRGPRVEPGVDASWSTPFNVSESTSIEYLVYSTSRAIYVDASGNVHMVYYTTRSTPNPVVYRKYDAGTSTWLPETTIAQSTIGSYYYRPAIAGDNSGNLHVAWYSSTAGAGYGLYYQKFDATSGWQPETLLVVPPTSALQYYPHVVCRPGGDNVHIAWYGEVTNNSVYRARHIEYVPGTGWSAVTEVDTLVTETCYDVSCAVDASNNVYMVWVSDPDYSSTYDRVWYRSRIGGTWGTAEIASPVAQIGEICDDPFPAVDGSGNVHVVWDADEPVSGTLYERVWYRVRSSGGGWGTTEQVSVNDTYYQYEAQVSVSGTDVHVTWRGPLSGTAPYDLQYRLKTGGNWQSVENVSNLTSGYAYAPQHWLDASGNVHAAWYSSVPSGNNDVWYSRGSPPVNNDVGVALVQFPQGDVGMRGLPFAPVGIVQNYGLQAQTSFAVSCTIYDAAGTVVYSNGQTVSSLNPGDTTWVTFANWTPAGTDSHYVWMSTHLLNDQNTLNDVYAGPTWLWPAHYTGGPDGDWYFWIDSDTAGGPTYSWRDTTGGTPVPAMVGDDVYNTIALPFTFRFYGVDYTSVMAGSNGWLSFQTQTTSHLTNEAIPNNTTPNALIAPLWDDLYGSATYGSQFYTNVLGTSPNREFVFSYLTWYYYGSPYTDPIEFQVILHESDNSITVQYADVLKDGDTQSGGVSATIGIENTDGTDGLEYVYNANRPGDLPTAGRAIRFYRDPMDHDIATAALTVPTAFEAGAVVYPTVQLNNNGTNDESNIPVYVEITEDGSPAYSQTVTFPGPLAAGNTVYVPMTVAYTVPAAVGTAIEVTCWHALAGDEYPANDTLVVNGTVVPAPNRYFKYLWDFDTGRPDGGVYGVTGVQDTLVWASVGFLAPWKMYIYDFRTQAILDSFDQYCTGGSYGYRDLTYDPVENVVYAGTESNRLDKINADAPYNLIATYTVTGANLPSVVRSLTLTGDDSLYTSNWGTTGLLKMAKDGSNCHRVTSGALGESPYGFGYDQRTGMLYGVTGAYTGQVWQWVPGETDPAHDTVLAEIGSGALFSGVEVFKDTFLLMATQATPDHRIFCYRIIPLFNDPGVVSIEAPTGRYDTMAIVMPVSTVRNFSATTPADFDVWMVIDDPTDGRVYSEMATLTLGPGMDSTIYWPVFSTGMAEGDWVAKCSIPVTVEDEDPDNNLLEQGFTVSARPPWPEGWVEMTPMPSGIKPVKDGGWLAIDPETQLIYATRGNKTPDFFRYDAVADTWTTLAPFPDGIEGKPPRKGSRGIVDGNGFLYATKGNNTFGFWKYDIQNDTWGA